MLEAVCLVMGSLCLVIRGRNCPLLPFLGGLPRKMWLRDSVDEK